MRRFLAFCMLLSVLLAGGAGAEEAPVIIDRINTPEENAGFAFEAGAELLEIVFPQILNCDAALVRCGGETMLIDCATAQQGQRVVNLLEQLGVMQLDYVVNSHPHYDHLQGLEVIAQAVEVKELIICFPKDATKHMTAAMAVCEKHGIPVASMEDGDRIMLGDAVVDVWLKGDEGWSMNERSAQMRIQFGDRTALFTGDMEAKIQQRLMEVIPAEQLDVDVLKYPHHGLEAMNAEFLALLSPEFAVITNNGGKMTRAARGCLKSAKIPFAVTVPGYVALITDGHTWLAERIPMDKAVTVTSRPDTRP